MKVRMFRSKRVLSFLVGGALIVLAGGVFLFSKRGAAQPKHLGLPLTTWLQQYRSAPAVGGFLPVLLTAESDAAVKAIGTNAIPTLVQLMTRPDNALPRKMIDLLNHKRLPHAVSEMLYPFISQYYNPPLALLGFRALGAEADGAIPALVAMLHSEDDFRFAVMALCTCGVNGATALTETFPSIGDPTLRSYVLDQLEYAVTPLVESHIASFIGERMNAEPHPNTRMSAARVLGTMTNSLSITLPALTTALGHRDLGVQFMAIDGLAHIGPEAADSSEALESFLESDNPSLRRSATLALRSIQAEAEVTNDEP